jgi:hypothetical protein
MVVNQSWHASINASPAKIFLSREIMTPTKLLVPRAPRQVTKEGEFPEILENKIQFIWQTARKYLEISKEAQKHYYDQKLVLTEIDVGDRVYKYDPKGKAGLATKLIHHWIVPYVVTKVTGTNAWIRPISDPYAESKCIHLNMLKRYRGTNVPPEDTETYRMGTDDDVDNIPEGAAEPGESRLDHDEVSQQEEARIEELDRDFVTADMEHDRQEQEIVREEQQVQKHGLRQRVKKRVDENYIYY